MVYSTEQELFWAGEFGDEFTRRNRDEALVAANADLFHRVLAYLRDPHHPQDDLTWFLLEKN